jgi:uncharacterized protein YqhQ
MSKKLKVYGAISSDKGIAFNSTRNKGYCAMAHLNDDGTIETSYEEIDKKSNLNPSKPIAPKWLTTSITILGIAMIVYSIFYMLYYDDSFSNTICYSYLFMSLLCTSFIIVKELTFYWKTPKGRITGKFHSAEHMAIQAIEKLQKVPTLEEIRCFSRLERSCSTNPSTILALIYFLASFWGLLLNGVPSIVVYVFSLVLIIFLLTTGRLNFMQYITTVPPTDKELKVAIACAEEWFNHETIDDK